MESHHGYILPVPIASIAVQENRHSSRLPSVPPHLHCQTSSVRIYMDIAAEFALTTVEYGVLEIGIFAKSSPRFLKHLVRFRN